MLTLQHTKVIVYDCEVYYGDWVFVFKDDITNEYTVIHNDPDKLREYIYSVQQMNKIVFVGFNNKHYDNHILKAIINYDFSTIQLKVMSDEIIGGATGWEYLSVFNTVEDYNHLDFYSCDLMDDCQDGLSLKSIEAHLGMNIDEADVDFNIQRNLTDEELQLTIEYCKHDVDATQQLYHLREGYLQTKINLGNMFDYPEYKSMGMTNTKLTAKYLGAKRTNYDDERGYKYPDNLLMEYIPQEVIQFYAKLGDMTIPNDVVFHSQLTGIIGDCEYTLGFGGIHGDNGHCIIEADDNIEIINMDVGSYYPHLMTINGYTSRSIKSAQAYADMLETRMQAKAKGDKNTANALKLVCNSTYGGTLDRYNDMNDPLMARSVCISGQLYLLELSRHLYLSVPTVEFIQLNTDGLMFKINKQYESQAVEILDEWQRRTHFTLERDDITKIVQKDVNNYIEIKDDGSFKCKGGYLVRGIPQAGGFNINNNFPIVSKAVIEYFVKGTPVEDTVNACNDIHQYQIIAKASGKYSKVLHEINDLMVEVQRCNRVYAAKDISYGKLYKIHKTTNSLNKISNLPSSCIVDNDNHCTMDDIDKEWYINLAERYIRDFKGITIKRNTRKVNKIKKEILEYIKE